MTEARRIKFMSFSLIFGFFLMWEVLCIVLNVSDLVLPRPTEIIATLWVKFPILWPHICRRFIPPSLDLYWGLELG